MKCSLGKQWWVVRSRKDWISIVTGEANIAAVDLVNSCNNSISRGVWAKPDVRMTILVSRVFSLPQRRNASIVEAMIQWKKSSKNCLSASTFSTIENDCIQPWGTWVRLNTDEVGIGASQHNQGLLWHRVLIEKTLHKSWCKSELNKPLK